MLMLSVFVLITFLIFPPSMLMLDTVHPTIAYAQDIKWDNRPLYSRAAM